MYRESMRLGVEIEKSVDGESWALVAGAPGTVDLKASDVLGALRGEQAGDRRALLVVGLLREQVRAHPALLVDRLIDQVEEVLPDGWPVVVSLDRG